MVVVSPKKKAIMKQNFTIILLSEKHIIEEKILLSLILLRNKYSLNITE